MATPISLLLQEPTKTEPFQQPRPMSTSTRGRKPSKCPPRKKHPPQRGMGVAQLEHLRLQEWRKTVIEANQMNAISHLQLPLDDPLKVNSIPLQYGSVSNNGMDGFEVDHQIFVNPYLVGAPVQLGLSGNNPASAVFGTSKELSSMPKIITQQCAHTCCDVCTKKKRFGGERIVYGESREGCEVSPNFKGSNFHGFRSDDFNGEFGLRSTKKDLCANNSFNAGMEAIAVHRKGNSVNGRVIVEYQFFPGKSSDPRSTSSKDMEASVAVDTNASSTSNFVDLSLKLSF